MSHSSRTRALLRSAAIAALVLGLIGAVQARAAAPAAAAGISEISLPGATHVLDAVTVPGDAIYLARGPEIVRIVPGSSPQTFELGGTLNARVLAVAPDGTVWFGGMNGTLGTIAPDGTVTTKALVQATDWVVSMAFGNDGALWLLASTGGWNHLERGTAATPMTAVALPLDANHDEVVRGGSGAVVLLGATDATMTSDGTSTPLTGVPAGTTYDVETIGTDVWVATSAGLTTISSTDTLTTYGLASLAAGAPSIVAAGPNGTRWYTSGASLGRIGASGPDPVQTVLAATTAGSWDFGATQLVADPSADRLWAIGMRSNLVRVVPIDLTRPFTHVTTDDPGAMTFGVPATVTAHVSAWDTDAVPTGTVTFSSNGATLGTAPVAADGSATATISPTSGSMELLASYSGDATYQPGRSTTRYQGVADAATVLTITGPPKPWRPGALTFSVTVTSPSGAKPTGTVKLGIFSIPVAGGVASTFTATFEGGAVSMAGTFNGDAGYQSSTAALPSAMVSWDTDEENFVSSAYLRLFRRLPDPSGRTYWAGRIRDGLARDRYALTMVATTEYRRALARRNGLIGPTATVAQAKPVVDALAHKTVRQLLVEQWSAAARVSSCRDDINPTFAPPGSFMCWVKVIYTTFRGSASSADFDAATKIGNTTAGRTQIAHALIYSDHVVQQVVGAAYSTYLNRPPDPSGLAYWTSRIQAGAREEGVEARVLGSDEFFRRTLLPPADH
ncbi:Ig-like domain repeat protein [Aquihabitans sp. McL0605]|uniref:Ig-like domain repeat protein n=1 Tax=Aquihabitans sp. McL0605 TaxID=3415671 RepID=UPI003CF03E66